MVRGKALPSLVLQNGMILNAFSKTWEKGNVWILGDRIVYVGEDVPASNDGVALMDCEGLYLVPGYVEPHAHPFQLYNPVTLASYAAIRGTTTLICDNLLFFQRLSDDDSFKIIEELDLLPTTLFWWCRYDNQTIEKASSFTNERMDRWLKHPLVVQGGELTDWPRLVKGDDQMLQWLMRTRQMGKQIEGHLPGASDKTLTEMALYGVTADHEAMTADEAYRRLKVGLSTSLRYSSIRPDLPDILKGLVERGLSSYQSLYMTTDGGTPAFCESGLVDRLIQIALDAGVPEIEAYLMATSNPARHYGLNRLIGELAPGRLAHINFLLAPDQPVPFHVLAKGKWVKKEGQEFPFHDSYNFSAKLKTRTISWDLTQDLIEPTSHVGMELKNAVISQPYVYEERMLEGELPAGVCYLTFIDAEKKWRVSTLVKGFADTLSGFASSYSGTGSIILIGRNKSDIIHAFNRVKELNGGIVIAEEGSILAEIPLLISAAFSDKSLPELIKEDKAFQTVIRDKGYRYEDPYYSLNFFSAIHLPYIRITPAGLYDVMGRKMLAPSIRIN
ncbi:adenine deaminase C-terminal domain-containing protein [Pullulanibacillus sp. KACC 23026]|uniref:adenine deaminase C-terminal domain-containing protein n=1 Tax=Pullulanibacillus sp. KACC 23026 TaxID=3028315 RepID=UPI0023B0BDED|nr:adenine deaminase C-terminal domain-containing protein [Pullulanibacillus sp. KACC 23026]WEG12388.1 adenine deaminase C-terminal domain-containing protein [Pullulanibacillus sp. KACC 23026]